MRKPRLNWWTSWMRRGDRPVDEKSLCRNELLERSHDARKDHVTEANKRGMGFNGL